MYPFFRMAKEAWVHRNAPALKFGEIHVSHHMCWPWDLDPWMELNNGRTLTLFDLGRIPLAKRSGLVDVLKTQRWGMTMAGACVRYRRRVRAFEQVEMRSRGLCWDDRFVYLEQSMWRRDGQCANHIVYRSAFVDKNGIVPTERVIAALCITGEARPIPDWIAKWIEAENLRPWPPLGD